MTDVRYVGPDGATSERYGVLERGRVYQETEDTFAAYLVATHPDHWQLAAPPPPKARAKRE